MSCIKYIFITTLLMLSRGVCMGQSSEMNTLFKDINHLLEEYEFESENDSQISSDKYYTHNIQVSFQYPTLKIVYTESYRNGGIWCSGEQEGKHAILLNIENVEFSHKSNSRYIEISSPNGIEMMYKGKKKVKESTFFSADKFTSGQLCDKLQRLKNLILSENFKGRLGVFQASTRSNGSMNREKKQTKGKVTKSGKYGE